MCEIFHTRVFQHKYIARQSVNLQEISLSSLLRLFSRSALLNSRWIIKIFKWWLIFSRGLGLHTRDTPNRFVQLNSWPAEGAVYGLLSSRCCSCTLNTNQENTIYSKPKDLTGRSVTSLKRLWCNRTVFGGRLLSCTAFANSATTFSHPAFWPWRQEMVHLRLQVRDTSWTDWCQDEKPGLEQNVHIK